MSQSYTWPATITSPPVGGATAANQVLEIAQLTAINANTDAVEANQLSGNQKTQVVDGSGNVWGPRTGAGGSNWMPVLNLEAGTSGLTHPFRTLAVGGSDGTNLVDLLTDATGKLIVNVAASVLPTGAATEATLATRASETTLSALNAKSQAASLTLPWDELDIAYVGATTDIDTVTSKLVGVTQETLTMGYDGSNRLTSVVKS